MKSFDLTNWYWFVAGDTTRVYSSALGNYVLPSNATYLAWLASGGVVTKIDTELNLGEVLSRGALRPIPAGIAQGFDDTIVKELETMKILRAYSLVVLDEINLLRQQHSLPDRTVAQLKAAVRAKLGI